MSKLRFVMADLIRHIQTKHRLPAQDVISGQAGIDRTVNFDVFHLFVYQQVIITIPGSDFLSDSGSFQLRYWGTATGSRVSERHGYNRIVR